MKVGFLLNGLLEVLGGLAVFLLPYLLFPDFDGSMFFTKLYGIIAVCFGLISLIMWKSYEPSNFFRRCFLVVLAFHMMVSFHCYGFYQNGFLKDHSATIVHLIAFLILTALYLRDIKPEKQKQD